MTQKTFTVVNIERIESARFIVANVYDEESGYLSDQIIHEFEDYPQSVEVLRSIGTSRVWTSDRELYALLLQDVGIAAEIKHSSDTAETKRVIEEHGELLTDIYEIAPLVPLPKLPKWRRWGAKQLRKLTNYIEGDGKYDND